MKNSKLIIILIVLAVILLGGFTLSTMKNVVAEIGDTYNVVIRYQTLDAEGEPTLYKTYSKEYVKGEQINIKSPEISGYKPDKQSVSAVVKSDLYLTVNYRCQHKNLSHCRYDVILDEHIEMLQCKDCGKIVEGDKYAHVPYETLDEVIEYPTPEKVGTLKRYCTVCDGYYQEEFTTLTRTVTFGGEALNELTSVGQVKNGYTFQNNGYVLILQNTSLPELDIIFNGIKDFDGNIGLSEAATVSFSYDREAWNGVNVVYKGSPRLPVIENADFSFRFGGSWRILFGFEGRSEGKLSEFVLSSDCPLKTAPLTITLTYDYTYTE